MNSTIPTSETNPTPLIHECSSDHSVGGKRGWPEKWPVTAKDDALFTPGPLTTSPSVKQAMLRDMGSRDSRFIQLTQNLRERLLKVAEVGNEFTSVLVQGSGTFAVEAVISTVIPEQGKLLVLSNGAYGARIAEMAHVLRIKNTVLSYLENERPNPNDIEAEFKKDPALTHVVMVHCETTSGIFNPIQKVGELCAQYKKTYIVDAMSSFGGAPLSLAQCSIDYLVSSANKCLEGVPGVAFVIARKEELLKTEGRARSLSLDLYSQWKHQETAGEFRYTPPTQVLLALEQALNELDAEGGVSSRTTRYQENHRTLIAGMTRLGFKTYLKKEDLGHIITSFINLEHPRFEYQEFYEKLQQRGFIIYSGKVCNASCFRIGNIGRLFRSDVSSLLTAIRETLLEMKIEIQA